MRTRSLLLPILVGVALAPVAAAQTSPPPSTPPTLPASFYDVDVREQLGFSTDPAPSQTYVVTIAGRTRPPVGAAHSVQASSMLSNSAMLAEFRGATRFIIDSDSLLFRNGRYHAEIAISSITSVEEISRPQRNQNTWVKITYLALGDERLLFVRRTGTRHQQQILDALAAAIAQDRRAAKPEGR